VTLHRRGDGFGLRVKGTAPVSIASVDEGSPAELGGVRQGDVIVGIGGTDARWLSHEEVVALVKTAGDSLHIRLVTPMDAKGNHFNNKGRISPHSTTSSGSLVSCTTPRSSSSSSSGYGGSVGRSTSRSTGSTSPPGSDSTMKKITRTLFRRSKSKEKTADLGYKSNVILR